MTVTYALILNVVVSATVVAALAWVCRIPYGLDRVQQWAEPRAMTNENESAPDERAAA